MVLWRSTRPYRTNRKKKKKDSLFIIGDWKIGSQEIPGITDKFGIGVGQWSRGKTNNFLPKNALVIANTLSQSQRRQLYTRTSPDGQYQNQIDYILSAKDGEALYSQPKQELELTVAQIMDFLLPDLDLNWRKGKQLDHLSTTSIKSLMIIQWKWKINAGIRSDRQSAWRITDRGLLHFTGGHDQNHLEEKEMQKEKWLSEVALQTAEKRREAKGKGENESHTHQNAKFQRTARRDKKAFLSDQCKEIEENNRMGKTRDLFKKIRDTKETIEKCAK